MEKEVVVSIPQGFRGTITIKLVISEEDKQSVFVNRNARNARNARNDLDQYSELIIKPNPTRS